MGEKLNLLSPHKLLKNLGALSEYAKCCKKLTKLKKKFEIFFYMLDMIEWPNKPSHATVPLRYLSQ